MCTNLTTEVRPFATRDRFAKVETMHMNRPLFDKKKTVMIDVTRCTSQRTESFASSANIRSSFFPAGDLRGPLLLTVFNQRQCLRTWSTIERESKEGGMRNKDKDMFGAFL